MRRAAIGIMWLVMGMTPALATQPQGEDDGPKPGEGSGHEVQLQLKLPEGVTLPEGFKPQVYLSGARERQRQPWNPKSKDEAAADPNQLTVDAQGDGVFAFHLGDPSRKFYVGIHEPGFLRFFEAGPFSLDDVTDHQLEVDVPMPASVSFGLKFDATVDKQPFETVQTDFLGVKQDRRTYFVVHDGNTKSDESAVFSVTDLPPGNYMLNVSTSGSSGAESARRDAADPARFRASTQIDVVPGQNDAVVEYVPFDAEGFRGDHNAELKVTAFGGGSAAGKPLKVVFNDPHYGPVTVYDGLVPDDGVVLIEGLADQNTVPGPFMVLVNDRRIGTFQIKPDEELQKFAYSLPPGPGDRAPDIEFTDIRTGETRKLSASLGKPVFLEFWATWCGPCQPPLEKIDKLIAHETEWVGKIDFLPISIDNEITAVNPHLEGKGWTNLPQYWTGVEGEVGFRAPAPEAYSVRGIPDAMLIDADGTILWRGHPMSVDLKEKVNEVLGLSPDEKSKDAEASDNAQS